MPKAQVINLNSSARETVELPSRIFDVTASPKLITQLINAERANVRNTVASTKTRAAVRGGGRKPWRQKGTGRARAGSIRSPLWRGGGIVFGPNKNRNFSQKVNRQHFRKGLFAVLTDKLAEKKVFVISGLSVDKIKTKDLVSQLDRLYKVSKISGKSVLVISKPEKALERSARNLENISVLKISDLSPYTLLKAQNVYILKDALSEIEKRFKD